MTARLECSIIAGENGFFHVTARSESDTRAKAFEVLEILFGMTSGKTHTRRTPPEVETRCIDGEMHHLGSVRFSLKNEPGEELLDAPIPSDELPYIQFLWEMHFGGRYGH